MSKIKYNETNNRWELLDDSSNVLDYASGTKDSKPWDLNWGQISISAGGSVDTTATEGDILSGETAVVRGKKITGKMPNMGSMVISPTAGGAMYGGGYYKDITVEGDTDLTSANIKNGVTIFGVTGTLKEGSDITLPTGITVQPANVLSGVTYIDANGTKQTGTMTKLSAKTYTPGVEDQTINAGQYINGTQTIKGDSQLKSGNIKKDVTIFGVTGTLESDVYMMAEYHIDGNMVTITAGVFESEQLFEVGNSYAGDSDITPGTDTIKISSGTYLPYDIYIEGDSNLSSGNIKSGVSIFGVQGTYEGTTSTPEYTEQGSILVRYNGDILYNDTVVNNGSYTITNTGFKSLAIEYEGLPATVVDTAIEENYIEPEYVLSGYVGFVNGNRVVGTYVPSTGDEEDTGHSGPFILVTNSSIDGANGKYYREIWVEDEDFDPCEDKTTAKWVASNGFYIREHTGGACEIWYEFCNSNGTKIYALPNDMGLMARASNYNLGWYVNVTGGSVAWGEEDGVQLNVVEGTDSPGGGSGSTDYTPAAGATNVLIAFKINQSSNSSPMYVYLSPYDMDASGVDRMWMGCAAEGGSKYTLSFNVGSWEFIDYETEEFLFGGSPQDSDDPWDVDWSLVADSYGYTSIDIRVIDNEKLFSSTP